MTLRHLLTVRHPHRLALDLELGARATTGLWVENTGDRHLRRVHIGARAYSKRGF